MNAWTDRVILVAEKAGEQDEDGFQNPTVEAERTVYGHEISIGTTEVYEAARANIRLTYKLQIRSDAYAGEVKCRYRGNTYRISRSYEVPNKGITEITLAGEESAYE